jgi:hypothetical protein
METSISELSRKAISFTIINHTVAYRVAVFFRAAPLAAPAVVRSTEDEESADEKKPLEKTPGEKPIALWATSAPNGAGVLSNGYHFVGISPPTEQTVSQLIGGCKKRLRTFLGVYPTNTAGDCSQRAGIHALNLTGIRRM